MALFMAVAAVYGVLQVFVLGWAARTVRLSTALLAIAVGAYGCGVAVLALEFSATRAVAAVSSGPLADVVDTASFTAAPIVEELVKVTPLLLVAVNVRPRLQWGLTDHVVLGAGLGAGFGLLEAMARFSHVAERAQPHPDGGWIVPTGIYPPYVPGPLQLLSSWFPAPAGPLDLMAFSGAAAGTSQHLVWSAMGGLTVGLLVRGPGKLRLFAPVPIVLATAQHCLVNYLFGSNHNEVLQSINDAADAALWVGPLACLAVSVTADVRQLRQGKRAHPDVLVAAERSGRPSLLAFVQFGVLRIPWTAILALRYVRLRRSLFYATQLLAAQPSMATRPSADDVEPIGAATRQMREQIDAANDEGVWRSINPRAILRAAGENAASAGPNRRRPRSSRRWLLVLWCLLLAPAVAFLTVGSLPEFSDVQGFFASGAGYYVLVGAAIAGLACMAWRLASSIRAMRTTKRHPFGEVRGTAVFRLLVAFGACVAGVTLLGLRFTGIQPDEPVLSNYFLLEALSNLMEYASFALLLAALFALFPPGGLAALATGGSVVIGNVVLTVQLLVLAAAAGRLGVVLQQAADAAEAGGGGSGGGGTSGSPANSAADAAVDGAQANAAKTEHIFRNRMHDHQWEATGLDDAGNWNLIKTTLTQNYNNLPASGVYEVTQNFGNYTVTVRGAIVNGEIRIGTAWVNVL